MNPYVLMIDDNPGDLQLIEEAFKDCRMTVTFQGVATGEEAVAHLQGLADRQEALPQVLIIDLNLPGLDGRQTIGVLRADGRLRHLPVVVFSSETSLDAASLGADAAVVKPASYRDYLNLVKGLRRYWASRSSRVSGIATARGATGALGAPPPRPRLHALTSSEGIRSLPPCPPRAVPPGDCPHPSSSSP